MSCAGCAWVPEAGPAQQQLADDVAWQRVHACNQAAAHSLLCGAAVLDAARSLCVQGEHQLALAAAHNDVLQAGVRALQAPSGKPAGGRSPGSMGHVAAAGASRVGVLAARAPAAGAAGPGPSLIQTPRPWWSGSAVRQPQDKPEAPDACSSMMSETVADILQLQRGLWSTEECRRRSLVGPAIRAYRLLPSSLPPGSFGPPAPHDLYSYLCLKAAIRACMPVCRSARDTLIRFAKRLDSLDTLHTFGPLRGLNPLVLVHGEVLAAIRAQSARVTHGIPAGRGAARAGCAWGAPQLPQERRRTLADLGVGSLVRLALQLQAAMQGEPFVEWFRGGSADSF